VVLAIRWFNPVTRDSVAIDGPIETQGLHRFTPPANGDWVLQLSARDDAGRVAK
jgi:hypothetical protein